jgi:hypothetical protein
MSLAFTGLALQGNSRMPALGRVRSSAWLVAGTVLAAACGTTDVPEPAPLAAEADYAIISNPTAADAGTPASGVGPGGGQAYVSVLPGTFSAAAHIVIRNDRTGNRVEAETVGGGLDPVAIAASAGDKLDFTALSTDGSSVSFARAVPARKRPRVIRVNPPKGRTDVAINASVVVVFSEPVDPATVTDATVRLEQADGGAVIAGTITVAVNGLSATYVPEEDLAPDTEYRIAVTDEVRDRDGSPVEAPLVSSFRTEGVPTAPTPIPPSLTSNVIAFRNYLGGIMLMSANGGEAVSIFGTTDRDADPAWSPDGRSLVLTRGRYDGPSELIVLSADGTGTYRRIGEGIDPVWSPDGSRIAFASSRSGNSDIYLMNPDGAEVVRLTDDPEDEMSPAWSPDGREIVFVRAGGGIFIMHADGSEARPLGQGGGAPAWSPDGTRIAFERFINDHQDIWVVNADGSDARALTNNVSPAASNGPTWSPDSRRLAFAHTPDPENIPYQIFVINADGTGMAHLGPGREGFLTASFGPAWSPR